MKILILSDGFPPKTFGGAGIVSFYLAKGLQKKGHSVFIITTVRKKSEAGEGEYEGMKIFNVYSNYPVFLEHYFTLYNPQTVGAVKRIIKKIQPDIVHAHHIHFHLSYYCLKIARQYSKAVFLTVQDVALFHYGKLINFYDKKNLSVQSNFDYKVSAWRNFKIARKRYNPLRNMIIRHYLKYADKIFTTSHALKKALNDNGIENIEVIHSGIEANDWLVKDSSITEFKNKFNLLNKRIILYGGRLSGAKGAGQIIKAMKKIIGEIPDAILLMVGKKDNQTPGLIELAKNLGLEKNLVFTDWVSGEELRAALWAGEIVVVPSICFDTFPTINFEAMACKRPVIATCFGGSPEIIQDGVTGYVINPNNTKMLAEKIIDLLKDKDKAKKFGEAGLKRVKEYFNLDLFVGKTLERYKQFITAD